MVDPAYPLSVVIATTVGRPRMRLSLDSVVPLVAAVGGQLIVADSSGGPVPAEATAAVDTIWLERPGVGVFWMRREGCERAAGQIIAATENHCRPDNDWVERILTAHAARPDAAAIGGAVENGTPAGGGRRTGLHGLADRTRLPIGLGDGAPSADAGRQPALGAVAGVLPAAWAT